MNSSPPSTKLTRDQLLGLYRQMVQMRFFESELLDQSKQGNLRGSLHLATGQEALPAGACLALSQKDSITMTYRGHGYALAKGCDLYKVVAEILGRSDGLCGGKGGKMHLFDPTNGVLGANGIVAGGIPTVLGSALASQTLKTGAVSMTVFGDGALNQGVAHEAMNLASLWKLPVIFLCENNLYAEMTSLANSSAETDLLKRASAYNMAAERIDGNDVLAVYDSVSAAVERGRNGAGPTFIEAMTYRTCGHYQLDPGTTYRPKSEVEKWEKNSPITKFRGYLTSTAGVAETDVQNVEKEVGNAVYEVFEWALKASAPVASDAYKGMFV